MTCTVLGAAAFIVTVLAGSTSRYAFQLDTALRSVGLDEYVLPVVREGIGAPVYSLAALAGIFLTTARYRRGGTNASTVEEPESASVEAGVEAGDDWWK